jgi:gamma-glutamyltranspeptidase/glutathione hydrolase
MSAPCTRRELLSLAGGAMLGVPLLRGAAAQGKGVVVGQKQGAAAGLAVLAAGGNAVDAAVTAALVAGVAAVHSCGIGGYGGHMTIARPDGKVSAIDFNSTAPAAAKPDLFPVDAEGRVPDRRNAHGWLAAGVPGTLAGMQLALDRFGTLSFRQAVQPAIRCAEEGVPVSAAFAKVIAAGAARLHKDPGCAGLLFEKGKPLAEGATYRNRDLARLLRALAERNSVADFYQGEIARRIAEAFRKNGGLVTAKDLAAYRAREVAPLALSWQGCTIHTPPPTAGGLTALQTLGFLAALQWEKKPADDPKTAHYLLEALRLAWADRLAKLGDPDFVKVPIEELLSEKYLRGLARVVETAVREGKPAPALTDGRPSGGTIHLSAADSRGMLVALTLTHGEAFGAGVAVDGLGLILGHGISRFDPRPGRANSLAPGKRPLHNMCPTVVLRDGKPVLALGATGGRRIVNAVCETLACHVGRRLPLSDAVAAPRLHTEGGLDVLAEAKTPEAEKEYLRKLGYRLTAGSVATLNAVAFDPATGTATAAGR